MKNPALHRPVVLSYFSQSGDSENAFLGFLEGEHKSIAKAWEQYHNQEGSSRYFDVFFPPRGNADGNKVAEDIRDFKNRIILFHFSGHAQSKSLLFEDGTSHAPGIAGLLSDALNLKLVVLNGCATHDQVNLLFENNVKIVIATKGKVSDGVAWKFAETFYKALSNTTYTIQRAFKHALSELQREHADLTSVSTEPIVWRGLVTGFEDDRDRWELYVKEESRELIDDPHWWRIGDLPSSYERPATLLSPKGVDNPNVFIGRNDELESIRARLVKGGKLMLLSAEGGIGKTTLAARYWHESLYEYQRNAWLFCENGIVNALKELAPQLNVNLTGLDEAQQLAALRHALSQIHDDFLLVLDNANDDADIQNFQREFAGFHWHVLITSRCQGVLDKEQELSINHLPPPLARELFERYYKKDSPDFDALLDRLLEAIRYHTLLVELFAKNLKEASELGTSLANFLQKLETGGLYLGEDSFRIQTPYTGLVQKAAATTDDILDILYDFSTLTEAQRYLLVNLALLPEESYTMLFLAEVMAPTDKRAFHRTLKNLYQKGWVGGADNTYRLSPVVQGLALKKNKNTLPADAKALLRNLAKKMDNDGANFIFLSLPEAAPLARLADTITRHLLHAPTSELASLNNNAGLYFENTGDMVQARQAFGKFGEISVVIGDTASGMASYGKLGIIYEGMGDWDKALENYKKCNQLGLNLYTGNPEDICNKYNLSVCYGRLGGIFKAAQDWKNALKNYQQQIRFSKDVCQSSPENLFYKNGLAISYSKLGGIYEATGDWKNALENYQEQLRIFKEIYQSSPENLSYKNGLAVSFYKLGSLELKQNEVQAALDYMMQSRTLFAELWEATQGQIVQFTFYFALNSRDVSRIAKWLIQNDSYKGEDIPSITEEIKQIRREGYAALLPLAEADALQQSQLVVLEELADESWYEF